MYNLVKVHSVLTVIFLTFFYGQTVNSELIPEDSKDSANRKFVVIKNESYFGGNLNKSKFIVTNDNFDQQSEDFSQFEEKYPSEFDSFEQVQEEEQFPVSAPVLKNGSVITRTYTFYSNNSKSVHQVPSQIKYEHAANYELVEPQQNVDALSFITQYYYRSIFIGNFDYFNEHWAAINTGNPTGYGAIAVKLSFAFPFYDQYLTEITINRKGFIETGMRVQYKDVTTQYIAPLMANFDVLTAEDSIVYYDDGEKFTVLWENVYLEGDEDNLFFFGVTLYRNGDIVFSYKYIPLTIKSIYEKDKNFKIGVSDTYTKENVFDEYRQLSFNNYDITSNTMLWMAILPPVTNAETQEINPITDVYGNIDEIKESADYKPNAHEETPIVSNTSQLNVYKKSDIEYQQTTEEQDIAPEITTETAVMMPDEKNKDKADETTEIESSTIEALFDKNLDTHKVDYILENDTIQPQYDIDDLKYVNNSFYNSVFISDSLYFNNHWENITKSKPLRYSNRNPHLPEKTMKLPFDFPFYDRIIRNIKVASDGFINLDDKTSDIESNFHYIAPLMSNFEIQTQSQNLIKNYEDTEKFTTIWDGVILGNENSKTFTFAVTLYHNGDIVFAYKDIPMSVKQVFDFYKQTRIGISDSTDDAHQISFKYDNIKSNTIIKISPTGNIYTDRIESSSTSPIQISSVVQPQTTTAVKSETSHRRFGENRNKYVTTTANVIEDTLVVTQSPLKITDEKQKNIETVPKVPNSRRKINGLKQKTSDNTSELSTGINKEEKFSQKVVDHQQTTLKNGLDDETNIHSIFMDRSDTIADLEDVKHPVNHNFYQSLLSNNALSFEDHWAEITNQKPLKLPGRSNPRRNDISQNLTFDFPFYNRNLRSITVTNEGFINVGEESHGLESTQYIAPLMANFDKKSIRQNSIKLYDDGAKFTALWENVRLQNDPTKIFTFAVTMNKNGEITFAYKNMAISIKMISEIDPQVKVGISDIFIKDGSIQDSNRQISFLSEEITEDSILKIRIKRSCEQGKCDNYEESDSDHEAQQKISLDSTTTNPLWDTINQDKNTSSKLSETMPGLESITKLNSIQTTLSGKENQDSSNTDIIKIDDVKTELIDTNSQINKNSEKVTEIIDKPSTISRPLVKITGLTGNIKFQGLNSTTKTNFAQEVVDEDRTQKNQSFSLSERNAYTSNTSDDTIKINDNNKSISQNANLIQADREINNLNYKYHAFYKSVFIGSTEYFNEHWEGIRKTKPLRQAARGNTRRSDTVVKLNFDFPFYNRTLGSITVANEGFIATNDRLEQELASKQYIAPLMINFTNKANSQSSIKLYNDIDKFTALWENLYLPEDKNNKFTFAVTLFKNGDIIFAYKNIPISVQELQSRGYRIKIGINNEIIDENSTHNDMSFTSYDIISDSLIKIMTLSSCESNNSCNSLNISNVDQIEVPTAQDPSLEKITQVKDKFKSTTATVHQSTPIEPELTRTDTKSKITSKNRRPIGIKIKDVPLKTSITTTTSKAIIDDLSEESETLESKNLTSNKTKSTADFSEIKLLSSENSLDSIRADSDVNNLNYVEHQFYKSAFIDNIEYFNNHWEGIIKSKQIKQAGRGNTRRSDINAKVAFGFPFYNETIRNIKVSVDGFIDTGYKVDKESDATWYISPFRTTFDTKINTNSIKLYQDGEKFTALWENVYFVDDKSKTFTFAVTLYKNGDIIFAYKDIPIKLYTVDEKDRSIKIGIYYLQTGGDNLQDDKRVVLFENYDISSETLLKLIIRPTCQDDYNCDKLRRDSTELPKVSSTQATGTTHLVSSKNNGFTNGRYVTDDSTKNIDNSSENLQDKVETSISIKTKLNGVRRNNIGVRTKITSDTSKSNTSVDNVLVPVTSDNEPWTKMPNIVSDKRKETIQVVEAEKDMQNVNYINHGLYKSTFIGNLLYFEEHWKLITSSKPLRQAGRSNSRRSDTVVKLTFDFPYFGHVIRNIIVTNEGLINIGDTLQHGLTYSQYIAPLRAPFDNKSNNKSKIRLYDDGEKFTTIWENVYLQEDISKTFTFAVTLFSNGNIIFAYKDIPAIINDIPGGEHQVQIGINDDQSSDVAEEYRHITFTSYNISNNTLLKLISLQTCDQDNSCESLEEDSTTVMPLTKPVESTTKSNIILKRPTLLQRKPPVPTEKSEVEALSITTKTPEESSESFSTISTTMSTGIKNGLIGNRRRVGVFGLGGKLINSKTVSEHQVTTENITQSSTDTEKTSNQNPDTRLDNTTTSPEIFEPSTKINGLRRKLPGRKDKNTSEIITYPKLEKTSTKNENDVLTEAPGILQSTYVINNSEGNSEIISKPEITGESEIKDFIEAEQNTSSLHYITRRYYKTAFFSDPLYFNEHWNTITKSKPLKQPGRSNTRRSNISIKLSFDFPYYDHMIRNITVTNQGSLIISNGDDVANVFTSMQYIAPLMVDFDSKSTPQSSIKLYDNDDKFTAIWEKLRLQDDRIKTFTFAVTLYKNGDILFAYKDIPLSVQTIGDKNELKIGLSDSKPDDKQLFEISFLSYKIVSGSIIKMVFDSSNNIEMPIQEKSLVSEKNRFDENLLNNTEIKLEDPEIDSDSLIENMSTELVPSLVTTESNIDSPKIKIIGNKRKPLLSTLSKISYTRPKLINSANEDDIADKKTITSIDSLINQSSDVNKDQDSEKDRFDEKEKKISVTTPLPQLNIRPPKINENHLRTINGIKYRKASIKTDTSTPVTLNEEIILQKSNEDSKSQHPMSDSDSQPEIQDDIDSNQELETQTLANTEQVTPTPPLSKSAISGFKGINRKLSVASNSVSRQTSATRDIGSLSDVKFRSRFKGRRQEITGVTQILNTETESQLQTSEYSKGIDLSQEVSTVKSDTLEQNTTEKTINSKISGSKFKVNTIRPRSFEKIKQSQQTELTDKQNTQISSKEMIQHSLNKNRSSESLFDDKLGNTSKAVQLIKAQSDISSLSYIYYGSYKSTFFSNSEYFIKYWEEITSENPLTQDAENSFTTMSLSFDFPFYGRILREVTVTDKGFIDISGKYVGVQSTHYIAPLMGNFESNIPESVRIFDDTDKFTVLWENLYFIQDKSKTFTFAVTLHKNGEIVFAYKDLNLSLDMIYDIDPEVYVGIRDGSESKQISFKYYDLTSDSILKLIKTDSIENITEVSERPTTTIKPLRLSIKTIRKKTVGDTSKIVTKTLQASETNSLPKDTEPSPLVVENTSKITGRRKISSRRYQQISSASKAVISNESQNKFTPTHEIAKPDTITSDVIPEVLESGDKVVAHSPDVALEKTILEGGDKAVATFPDVAVEKTIKIPGRRINASKRFQPVTSIYKTVVPNEKKSEIDRVMGDLRTEAVNSEVTPENFESKDNSEGKKSPSFVQNTFTRKVTGRRKVVGKRLQLVSGTTKNLSYDDGSEHSTESSPENHEIIKSDKATSGVTSEIIEPVIKTGDQSSSTFTENSFKTKSRRRIAGKRYQLAGTAVKLTSPSVQAKLEIPTVDNQEVSQNEQITSDVLSEPIEGILKTHITEERLIPGDSSIVAESKVELSNLEQEGTSESRTSADPVKKWLINQHPKRRRQKLVPQQS